MQCKINVHWKLLVYTLTKRRNDICVSRVPEMRRIKWWQLEQCPWLIFISLFSVFQFCGGTKMQTEGKTVIIIRMMNIIILQEDFLYYLDCDSHYELFSIHDGWSKKFCSTWPLGWILKRKNKTTIICNTWNNNI